MTVLLLLLGLIALVAGAEALVRGASRLALALGVSPLVVGLTIVAFGTSAPETAVSVGAALEGVTELAVGNVVGSNIFNILVVLGVSALIKPLTVHAQIIRQELPVMLGASILLVLLARDGEIELYETAVLVVLVVLYTVFLIRQSRSETRATQDHFEDAVEPRARWDRHWSVQILLVLAGLGLLVLGTDLLVDSAVEIARWMGVSDAVIGLTIVAAGTSLPEVVTSVVATLRGERDIAIGNVIGSNTFNILLCLGLSGIVSPDPLIVPASVRAFDLWVMLGVAGATIPLFITGYRVTRANGAVLLFYYLAYTTYLVLDNVQAKALPMLARGMMNFVVPGTVVAFVVMMLREPHRRTAPAPGDAPPSGTDGPGAT